MTGAVSAHSRTACRPSSTVAVREVEAGVEQHRGHDPLAGEQELVGQLRARAGGAGPNAGTGTTVGRCRVRPSALRELGVGDRVRRGEVHRTGDVVVEQEADGARPRRRA